jgi:hypothetical protein
MKKLVVLSAFLVFAYVGAHAQNKPVSLSNASQKVQVVSEEASENEKPLKKETKKECSDKNKKECHDKKGGKSKKSCCSTKSKKECGDKMKVEETEQKETK